VKSLQNKGQSEVTILKTDFLIEGFQVFKKLQKVIHIKTAAFIIFTHFHARIHCATRFSDASLLKQMFSFYQATEEKRRDEADADYMCEIQCSARDKWN